MKRKTEILLTSLGMGIAIGFAVSIAVGAFATDEADAPVDDPTDAAPVSVDPNQAPTVTDPARRNVVVRAVEKVSPTVVTVTTQAPTRDFFARFQGRMTSSDGSGVVIDASGIILTNAHVVAQAKKIDVTFSDGRSAEATVLGLAEDLDLAVLRITGVDSLKAVEIGTSSDLLLGEPAIAIGNPFGLGHTVTTGVISATSRPMATGTRVYQEFIQTDASINPGNSGGALLNANGQLIGITTSIRPDSEGINFAIPVDRAIKVAKDLVETGTVQIPWLGVTLRESQVQGGTVRPSAPQVVRVIAGGPGDLAGLIPGDVITSVNDHPVQGRMDLNTYISGVSQDAPMTVIVQREQDSLSLNLTPGAVDAATVDSIIGQSLGISLAEVSTSHGTVVKVTNIKRGTFARFGVSAGDIIWKVNGQRVSTIEVFRGLIGNALMQHRPSALFYIVRVASQSEGKTYMPL